MMNREAIYAALFARVSGATWAAIPITGATGFIAASRKRVGLAETPPDQMPALYQTQVAEDVVRKPGQPAIVTLKVQWLVYVCHLANVESTVIPTQQLNPILDAMQLAMEPNGTDGDPQRCTLGRLVYDCKIAGKINNYEGDLGDFGVLEIPVEIIVPF